jgi:hypothetical protein
MMRLKAVRCETAKIAVCTAEAAAAKRASEARDDPDYRPKV